MGDSFVTQAAFEDAVAKMISKMNDISLKLDRELESVRKEQSRLASSINNVQTQVLEKNGRFDATGSSSVSHAKYGPPPSPVHKLRFPKYDGAEDPLGWLHKCEQFFRSQATPEDQKVWTATFYLEGAAGQWYYRLEKNRGVPTWPDFVDGVNKRFGPPVRSNPLGELTQLRRTGSVEEYQEQFLMLLARCEGVTEQQQIDIFTAGLLQPMRMDVEMHKPASFEDAMALARAYERRTQVVDDSSRSLPRSTRSSSRTGSFSAAPAWSPSTPPASSASSATPGAPVKPAAPPGARFTRLTPEEMAQRRVDGLCFNCPEKFSREHARQCSMKGIY